ncbi:hypothetical protein NP493_28g05015 [Ridgeia piscesae]|uniref:Uncharacterized protein n=1 Tax=Ridgeia piscesae TaxID=27915 RepID=A0AAD9UK58_RIDPI|nr:hypothetical protein NP493_28g05015 [Ridgeia piscesae]
MTMLHHQLLLKQRKNRRDPTGNVQHQYKTSELLLMTVWIKDVTVTTAMWSTV